MDNNTVYSCQIAPGCRHTTLSLSFLHNTENYMLDTLHSSGSIVVIILINCYCVQSFKSLNETHTLRHHKKTEENLTRFNLFNYYTVHIRPSSSNTILSQTNSMVFSWCTVHKPSRFSYFSLVFVFVLVLISCFKTGGGFHPSPLVSFFFKSCTKWP